MRKIGSKHKEEKKQRRNQLIVGIVLASILFGSIFGYAFGGRRSDDEEENKIVYNGYEFVEQNGFYVTEIGGFTFSFSYDPNEVEIINSELRTLDNYYDLPLYISSDDEKATSEIYRNLLDQNRIVQRMQFACLEGEGCEDENLPVKTCADNVIVIQEADVVEVVQNESCVFIRGKAGDLAKLSDGFLLKIIGID